MIIVSYNTQSLLFACLDSMLRPESSGDLAMEVVVVDNASTDGSPAMVRSRFPSVLLVETGYNAGYAKAANAGIAASRGRYVLLLNSDVEVLGGALEEMHRTLERAPEAAVIGPQLLNPDGTKQESCFRFPTLAMSFLDFFPINHRLARSRLNGRYPLAEHREPFAIDHPLGACMMVKRQAVHEVGAMDEDFFMYCEEVDWCYRFKKSGWAVLCEPRAKVIHHGGQSTRQQRGAMLAELHRSRYMLFRKHYSHAFCLMAALITRVGVASDLWKANRSFANGEISRETRDDLRNAYKQILRMPVGAGR